ncbi:MAG: hypothetical protein ACI80L_001420 [Pseudohongiellaceae bacterium]|jgi:hypothetical protein
MTNLTRATLLSLATTLIFGSSAAYADHGLRSNDVEDLLLNVASAFLVTQAAQHAALDRDQRSRHGREYRGDRDNSARGFSGRHSNRDGYSQASFTSEPVRGGSSRRTRIVDNPHPNRAVTGVSFTGIDHDAVHINDVITYPRKRLISHTAYSLSLYHPSQYLDTRGYVDYISVKAKRKEYFTVTFHYE